MRLLLALIPALLAAQPNVQREAMEASIQKMQASLEKQRESVRKQVDSAVPEGHTSSEFFTVVWPKPATMLSMDCDPLPSARVDELVTRASTREGLKPGFLREVMQRESAFKPCAVSVKGAQGLMQLMPATARQFGVADPFDPDQNVNAGARFLKELLDKYKGDYSLALAAYNAGPGTVDRANGIPDNPETKAYVKEILKNIIL